MSFLERFLGRGDAAVTVPPLDGGLKPNNRLEELPAGIVAQSPDAITLWQGQLVWSEGNRLMAQDGALRDLQELGLTFDQLLDIYAASGSDIRPHLTQ